MVSERQGRKYQNNRWFHFHPSYLIEYGLGRLQAVEETSHLTTLIRRWTQTDREEDHAEQGKIWGAATKAKTMQGEGVFKNLMTNSALTGLVCFTRKVKIRPMRLLVIFAVIYFSWVSHFIMTWNPSSTEVVDDGFNLALPFKQYKKSHNKQILLSDSTSNDYFIADADTYLQTSPSLGIDSEKGLEETLSFKKGVSSEDVEFKGLIHWNSLPKLKTDLTIVLTIESVEALKSPFGFSLCDISSEVQFEEGSVSWSNFENGGGLLGSDDFSNCVYSDVIDKDSASPGSHVCFTVPNSFVAADGSLSALISIKLMDSKWERLKRSHLLVRVHSKESALGASRGPQIVGRRPKTCTKESGSKYNGKKKKKKGKTQNDGAAETAIQSTIPQSSFPVITKAVTKTLMVISTCNEVAYTLKMLTTLEKSRDEFDVLFVDDHSGDGTVDLVRRRGYEVISKSEPNWLTDRWNTGYGYFMSNGYDFLITTHSDILVPDGAVAKMQELLRHYPFMAPSTTLADAGHNSSQSLIESCDLNSNVENLISDPSNYQRIQNMLYSVCATGPAYSTPQKLKLGGFFFGLRSPELGQLEFEPGELFDHGNVLFGQENALMNSFEQIGLKTPHTNQVFVYHYNSVTVKKSGYKLNTISAENSNVKYYHPELNVVNSVDQGAWRNEDVIAAADIALGEAASFVVAFATSHSVKNLLDDDVFIAHDFGAALNRHNKWTVKYLDRRQDWYDLTGVDVLIALFDQYELPCIKNAKPGLVRVAWARNWFDRWVERSWFGQYDLILSSSEKGAEYFRQAQPFQVQCFQRCPTEGAPAMIYTPVGVLRIGTSMTEKEEVEVDEEESDYVLTMGYYKSPREIMNFDPSSVAPFRGNLYGFGCDDKAIPAPFRSMWKGPREYDSMRAIYQSTKIVIDDASIATKSWGSVNSRVFDAAAMGRLVVTNGDVGADEIFGDLLPTYAKSAELTEVLKSLLENPPELAERASALQKEVLQHHTYTNRAEELQIILAENSLIPRQLKRSCHDTTKKHQMCIITRLYSGHFHDVMPLLHSLLFHNSPNIEPRIFMVNTDVDKTMEDGRTFTEHLQEHADHLNDELGRCRVHLLTPPFTPDPSFFGYDATDWALENLLVSGGCSHIMATNGDNYYIPTFMRELEKEMNQDKELIAFDFLTHHNRLDTNVIKVEIKRKFIDLGAFVATSSAIMNSRASFMVDGAATSDLFARDWFFIDTIFQYLQKTEDGAEKVALIHRVLFSHQ